MGVPFQMVVLHRIYKHQFLLWYEDVRSLWSKEPDTVSDKRALYILQRNKSFQRLLQKIILLKEDHL